MSKKKKEKKDIKVSAKTLKKRAVKKNEKSIKVSRKLTTMHSVVQVIVNCKITKQASLLVKNAFTRTRKMTFDLMIYFILDLYTNTYNSRIHALSIKFNKEDIKMKPQSISEARAKFSHLIFETMFEKLVENELSGEYKHKLVDGYYVLAVDGTHLHVPKTSETKEIFKIFGHKGCTQAGMSCLYDVFNNFMIDASITTGAFNERTAMLQHIKVLFEKYPHIAKKIILLLDSGYQAIEIYEELNNLGVKFIIKGGDNSKKEIVNASLGKSIITFTNGTTVKVFKFKKPKYTTDVEVEGNDDINAEKDCNTITLVTNLFDMTETKIRKLYKARWGIETLYKKMKSHLKIEKFSGKTVNSIMQDFWARMVLLSFALAYQSEATINIRKERLNTENKHKYNAKISEVFSALKEKFIVFTINGNLEELESEIEQVMLWIIGSISKDQKGKLRNNKEHVKRKNPKKHRPNYNNKS